MKTLFKEKIVWSGVALTNNTNKIKVFKFFDSKRQVSQYTLKRKSAFMIAKPSGALYFEHPLVVDSLRVEAGKKWSITIRDIQKDDNFGELFNFASKYEKSNRKN